MQFFEGYEKARKKLQKLSCWSFLSTGDLENLCREEGLLAPIPTRNFIAYGKDVGANYQITDYCCICYLLHKRKEPWEGIFQTPCTFCPERGRRCERYINRQLIERTYGAAAVNYFKP